MLFNLKNVKYVFSYSVREQFPVTHFDYLHFSTFLPLTLKTFSVVPTNVVNICAKFCSNPSTRYRDVTSREC